MRLGEECPYITPCGWCSRQGKPCEKRNKRKRNEPIPELTEEEARAKGLIMDEQETEDKDMTDEAALIQATMNLLKLEFKQGEPEPPVAIAVPLEEDKTWQQRLSGSRDT